jgi:hypothetical protein
MWVTIAFAASPPAEGPSSMLPPPPPPPAPVPAPPPPAPDQPVWDAVDAVYGKPVPHSSVCVARPTVAEPLHGAPIAVATKRGALGCVLVGVMVDGAWYEPGAALPHALDPAAFAALDAAGREKVLLDWTDHVLLAFQQPHGLAVVTADPKTKSTLVDRQYFRRDDQPAHSVDAVSKWTYGPDLVATAAVEQVQSRIATTLFLRPNKVEGLDTAAVDAALTSKGLVIRQCFTDAWNRDLSLDGKVVLDWAVADGKVGTISVVNEAGPPDLGKPPKPADPELAKCYANAIRSAAYPAGSKGAVSYVFGIDRDVVKQ